MISGNEQTEDQISEPVQRTVRIGQLIDLYGPLLTERQLQFIKLHYEEDLSFGEIAKDFGVSRQAIHDAVKHGERALEDYDAKLGLSPDQVARPVATNAASKAVETSGPASFDGLGPCIRALEELHDRVQRSGGVIYNADGVARDLGQVLDRLRQMDSGN